MLDGRLRQIVALLRRALHAPDWTADRGGCYFRQPFGGEVTLRLDGPEVGADFGDGAVDLADRLFITLSGPAFSTASMMEWNPPAMRRRRDWSEFRSWLSPRLPRVLAMSIGAGRGGGRGHGDRGP